MKEWWQNLQPRERSLLGIGAFAVLAALVFLLVLEPLSAKRARLQAQLAAETASLTRVQALAEEAARLRQGTLPVGALPEGQSLLAVLNDSAQTGGIQTSIERVVPNGTGEASVTFDDIAFDALMTWMITLRERYGIEASRLVVDKAQQRGRVNANLTLVSAGR